MAKKLNLQDEREYFKPFNYPWAYEAWLKHEQSHWLHTEVPMAEDVKDWKNSLTEAEQSTNSKNPEEVAEPSAGNEKNEIELTDNEKK